MDTAQILEAVEMLLSTGDQGYLCRLSLDALGEAIENELRFLGLYAYEDHEAPRLIHAVVQQHLAQWRAALVDSGRQRGRFRLISHA